MPVRIWELFSGYEDAYGRYAIKRVKDNGKNEGQASTVREPVTQALWDAHLSGMGPGLGIVPLQKNDVLSWACIDIDVIGIDHKELENKCRKFGFPLVICRSKSGGAHAFIFFREPVNAEPVVTALHMWAAALGYAGCEVFPKQTLRMDDNDVGNWLNMPYYYADRTNRYCYHEGKHLSLAEFEEYAESMRVDLSAVEKHYGTDIEKGARKTDDVDDPFYEAPPCLVAIANLGGFPEGTRNEGMFSVCVYLKKRYEEDFTNHVREYNDHLCDPKLEERAIEDTINSLRKKDYEYKCSKEPLKSYCNNRLCRSRAFGVGATNGSARPAVLDVKKVVGEPTIWYMTVNNVRVRMTTDEFLNQNHYKKVVLNAVNVVPPSMPGPRWDKYITELAQSAEIEIASEDATLKGQLSILMEKYLLSHTRTRDKETLLTTDAPYVTGEGTIWFKLLDFEKYLKTQGFTYDSVGQLAEMLKDPSIGCSSKRTSIKGRNVSVWVVPQPAHEEEAQPEINFNSGDVF